MAYIVMAYIVMLLDRVSFVSSMMHWGCKLFATTALQQDHCQLHCKQRRRKVELLTERAVLASCANLTVCSDLTCNHDPMQFAWPKTMPANFDFEIVMIRSCHDKYHNCYVMISLVVITERRLESNVPDRVMAYIVMAYIVMAHIVMA